VKFYVLRVLVAFDSFVQAIFRYGVPGVTISSRIATAAAHGHRWGLVGWWLLDRCYPFGRVDGVSHCKLAVRNDINRACRVITELSDPILNNFLESLP
jgi:hypothetical protein